MVHTSLDDPHEECIHLPRGVVRFPMELRVPDSFRPEDPSTWPHLEGRIEYVTGRLEYMPPCGGVQQQTCSDVTALLVAWARSHPGFLVGSNEAGMKLGSDVRAADAAVFRRADVGEAASGLPRVPPVLAAEVAGQEEGESVLRSKARWYLDAGVEIVWIVLPESREVVVLTRTTDRRHRAGETLSAH